MNKEQFKRLSFQEFREQFSVGMSLLNGFGTDGGIALFGDIPSNEVQYLYVAPNEDNVVLKNRLALQGAKADAYYGVIGGVLTNFDYITSLEGKPQALLVDINEKAVDHLAFMLYCAHGLEGDAQLVSRKFVENIAELPIEERKIEDLFGRDSKGELPDFSIYQNPQKRRVVARITKKYFDRFTQDEKNGLWMSNSKGLTEALEEGRIKAFRDDYFHGGSLANRVLSGSEGQTLVVYASNVPISLERTNHLMRDVVKGTKANAMVYIDHKGLEIHTR
jgi:hypothetical protein